ncbi:GNAT family N-acetyltransferase [Paenibacillus glycinis]|uniref:GNAT family N-acetyltransferase n=1 Tax=Paenibacillus glycinis TaxID=2697035 RepID=A0ABW9XND1_9BACL|nr:GNAT family N-acetyltransferase [Paenibacillus glycinis]NBD24137.1 GNAT family N-acetyltransferase [Paenibacillus glycinis]
MANKQEAIRENMILAFEHLSNNNPRIAFTRTPNACLAETDIPFPIFNRVFDYRASEGIDIGEDAKSIAESYHRRGMKCGWHSYSHARDEAVLGALQANGFVHAGSMSGMSLSLEGRIVANAEVPGLRIGVIHTDEELEIFKRVFVAEYQLPDEVAAAVTRIFAYDPKEPQSTRYYLAYLNDEPVGTLMTFDHEDVTGIYTVATLKEFRSRGIGGAIVAHALRDRQAAGAKQAILQASAMGQSVYRKLGFEEKLTIDVYSG